MVPTHEIHSGLLDERPDLGRLEVLDFVLVGGSEMGAHGAVVAGDDDTAAAGRVVGRSEVLGSETSFGAGIAEDVGVFVRPHGADVED